MIKYSRGRITITDLEQNGRGLQDLLHQAAPRYIKALKRERAESKKSDEG
jgi:hypothetical protein